MFNLLVCDKRPVHEHVDTCQQGLRGIAIEAGAALVVDRTEVVEAADRAGLFVISLESST